LAYFLFGERRIQALVDFIYVRKLLVFFLAKFMVFEKEKIGFYKIDKSVSKNMKSLALDLLQKLLGRS
jgi:hypothetical protein